MYSSGITKIILSVALVLSAFASAQSANRNRGWEMGLDLVYQDTNTFEFDGGSDIETDEDVSLSLTFGYRYNSHMEAQFALDWARYDYSANLVRAGGAIAPAHGEMETFTPRFNLHYNLLDDPITPYVMAGIGFAFIDTNIPDGRPQTGCWWDPWYGYICTTYHNTLTTEEFTYQYGIGIRSDYSSSGSLRFAYERHYLNLDNASSVPYVDQFKVGMIYRY